MFRSRWLALIWVAMVLGSIMFHFGNGGTVDVMGKAAGDLSARQAALARPEPGHRVIVRDPEDDGFSSDKEVEFQEER